MGETDRQGVQLKLKELRERLKDLSGVGDEFKGVVERLALDSASTLVAEVRTSMVELEAKLEHVNKRGDTLSEDLEGFSERLVSSQENSENRIESLKDEVEASLSREMGACEKRVGDLVEKNAAAVKQCSVGLLETEERLHILVESNIQRLSEKTSLRLTGVESSIDRIGNDSLQRFSDLMEEIKVLGDRLDDSSQKIDQHGGVFWEAVHQLRGDIRRLRWVVIIALGTSLIVFVAQVLDWFGI